GNWNDGGRALPVRLLDEAGALLAEQRVTVPAGGEAPVRFEVRHPGPVRAELPADALAADDAVTLLPDPPRPLAVRLAAGGVLADAVRRFTAIEGAAAPGPRADLSFTPPATASTAPWTVAVGITGAARGFVAPFFADRVHPLLEDVDWSGAVWFAGDSPPGVPLLTAGDTVLLAETEGPVFHLNLDAARSNVHRLPAFPILLSNLYALRRQALPGFPRRNVGLGEELAISIDRQGSWTLRHASADRPLRGAGTVRVAPVAPGRHALLRDGREVDAAQVNALDGAESDLRGRGAGARGSAVRVAAFGGGEAPRRAAWPLFALALLLAADWAVTGLGAAMRGRGR
ncbi:MAG: hypothetical protein ACK4N5_21185, partial [Myxococcales bacterium]